ncbi:M20 family metallopeptidase [Lacticigenium naphthae]|uniref:M20 family metallopeptidase n=1 Tax=Lacticigenium naphthae TaxID=515351 RepID=UPI000410FD53|nr:M20 family metallopeptidase [Lacticigenium naphthae]
MTTWITDSIKEKSLEELKKLIAIPSVNRTEGVQSHPPFGKDIDAALKQTLELCESLGMKTYYDPEGFYGYADYGEGSETVGVLCHLDVVSPGDKSLWNSEPFTATIIDEVVYGRGTQDDKGPTIAALYAFKAVVDSGKTFNRKIRFIFGTDEEILWRCMDHYHKHEETPDFGFVPDSTFPLTYAEKELLQLQLVGPGSDKIALELGEAPNVVPGKAIYDKEDSEEVAHILEEKGIKFEKSGDTITVLGKSVHAKDSNSGINAINQLAKALNEVYAHPVFSFLAEKVGDEGNGRAIFGKVEDDVTGELTFNVGKLKINKNESVLDIDMRIPVKYSKEDLVPKLEKIANEYGLEYKEFDWLPSLYVPKDSSLVQTLLNIYRDKTGDEREPFVSGGATYARQMENFVAFGAHFPESPSLEHQENEGIKLEDFYKAMDIYAETINKFCCEE